MLEVWRRSSERPGHRGIEWSARRGEEQDCGDARADLEAAVGNVTVRHPIADQVEEQSEWQRAEPRTDERAAGCTGRNVKGDDQAASLALLVSSYDGSNQARQSAKDQDRDSRG